ncbi:hypothetical protein Y1Q_0021429 [Alligator mississippiensis]|uniref:Uncharacterized protein n=1 Tax=Alligator mississippiensis TaxID=8496 RepID=A0A151P9Y2_ALLMI|nr:hypothetical protein Y1Q_0021429 [Alligator mississippiensis]
MTDISPKGQYVEYADPEHQKERSSGSVLTPSARDSLYPVMKIQEKSPSADSHIGSTTALDTSEEDIRKLAVYVHDIHSSYETEHVVHVQTWQKDQL